jgi:phosphate starvation-inducible protein PhoH and related proteins
MSQSQDYVPVSARTEGQKRLVDSIRSNPITICTGFAGSGKSLIALYEAVQFQKQQLVRDVLYSKPIVQWDGLEGIGFLPGEASDKLEPLLWPVKDNLQVFCNAGFMNYLLNKKRIEPILLQDLRGRSLNDTFLIVDEAASVTPKVAEMILTRIGDRSKIVLMGDSRQKDSKNKYENGLEDAKRRLCGVDGVGIVELDFSDVIRGTGLCGAIQQRYAV